MHAKKIFSCFCAVVFIVLVVSACSNLRQPTDPAVATPTPVMIVYSVVQKGDNHELLVEAFLLNAMDWAGNTLTTAEVGMWGPNGQIGVSPSYGSMFYTTSDEYVHYVPDEFNKLFYFFKTQNDLVIAADGSSVSWDFTTDVVMINLRKPSWTSFTYGPYLSNYLM